MLGSCLVVPLRAACSASKADRCMPGLYIAGGSRRGLRFRGPAGGSPLAARFSDFVAAPRRLAPDRVVNAPLEEASTGDLTTSGCIGNQLLANAALMTAKQMGVEVHCSVTVNQFTPGSSTVSLEPYPRACTNVVISYKCRCLTKQHLWDERPGRHVPHG